MGRATLSAPAAGFVPGGSRPAPDRIPGPRRRTAGCGAPCCASRTSTLGPGRRVRRRPPRRRGNRRPRHRGRCCSVSLASATQSGPTRRRLVALHGLGIDHVVNAHRGSPARRRGRRPRGLPPASWAPTSSGPTLDRRTWHARSPGSRSKSGSSRSSVTRERRSGDDRCAGRHRDGCGRDARSRWRPLTSR